MSTQKVIIVILVSLWALFSLLAASSRLFLLSFKSNKDKNDSNNSHETGVRHETLQIENLSKRGCGNDWCAAEFIISKSNKNMSFELEGYLHSHPSVENPLNELSFGNIPAIIIRNVITPEQISYLTRGIGSIPSLGGFTVKNALKASKTQKEFSNFLQIAFDREKKILAEYPQYKSIVESMKAALSALAQLDKKKLTSGLLFDYGFEVPTVGVRIQGDNKGFPTHFDSLQASIWESKRSCREVKKIKNSKSIHNFVEALPHFDFRTLFSMIVMLHSGGDGKNSTDNAVRLHKSSFKDLVKICGVKGENHGIGVNLDGFSKWARVHKVPSYEVNLREGDI